MNNKRLTRIQKDHMVAGVCSGLAEYMDMDPTVIRLIFVLLFFVTGPGILLAYLIMAIVVPNETSVEPAQSVQPADPGQQS
jgi:phage shock protein C